MRCERAKERMSQLKNTVGNRWQMHHHQCERSKEKMKTPNFLNRRKLTGLTDSNAVDLVAENVRPETLVDDTSRIRSVNKY